MRALLPLVLTIGLLASGCGDAGEGGETPDDSAEQTTSAAESTTTAIDRTTIDRGEPHPEPVPVDTSPPIVGEVPEALLAEIVADAAERTGADPDDFTVVTGQFVQWNDGSLGCGEPGQVYTQAIVDGYWVVLEVDGVGLDYRATTNGVFRLCESPFATPPGGNPSS